MDGNESAAGVSLTRFDKRNAVPGFWARRGNDLLHAFLPEQRLNERKTHTLDSVCAKQTKKKLLKSPLPRRPIRDHILGCSLSPFLSLSVALTHRCCRQKLADLLVGVLPASSANSLHVYMLLSERNNHNNIQHIRQKRGNLSFSKTSLRSLWHKSQVRPELCPPVTIFKSIHCYLKPVCLKIRARMYVKCQQVTQKSILFLTPLPLPRHIFA